MTLPEYGLLAANITFAAFLFIELIRSASVAMMLSAGLFLVCIICILFEALV